MFKKSISIPLFVSFLTDVDVFASQLDHAVDQKSEFVGDRSNAFRCAQAATDTATKSAQSTLVMEKTLSGHP
jgi:hypothetical protein